MASTVTIPSLVERAFIALIAKGDITGLVSLKELDLGIWREWQHQTRFTVIAALAGQVGALVWLWDEGFRVEAAAMAAARSGCLPALQLLSRAIPEQFTQTLLEEALKNNRVITAKWLVNRYPNIMIPRLTECMDLAARGELELLQWCHTTWGTEFMREIHSYNLQGAAGGGQIPTIEWLLSLFPEFSYPSMWEWAALNGHLEVLQWGAARDYEFPNSRCMDEAAGEGGTVAMLEWFLSYREVDWQMVGYGAARGDNRETLLRAVKEGYTWGNPTFAASLYYQNKEQFLWLLEMECPYDREELYRIANSEGSTELLGWLDEHLNQ
jgi:hypothetical protein